jgi:hypothetical protein
LEIQAIVKELKRERDRLDKAITALDETELPLAPRMSPTAANQPVRLTEKTDHLTPEGRKRLSEMMKKRWAERRRKAARGRK